MLLKPHSKLLNIREFQARIGVSSQDEKALQSTFWQTDENTNLVYSISIAFHAKELHWPSQVSCLHAVDPSMMNLCRFPKEQSYGSTLPPDPLPV